MEYVINQKEGYKEFLIDNDSELKDIKTQDLYPGSLCYSTNSRNVFIYGPDYKGYNKQTGLIDIYPKPLKGTSLGPFSFSWGGDDFVAAGLHGFDIDPINFSGYGYEIKLAGDPDNIYYDGLGDGNDEGAIIIFTDSEYGDIKAGIKFFNNQGEPNKKIYIDENDNEIDKVKFYNIIKDCTYIYQSFGDREEE